MFLAYSINFLIKIIILFVYKIKKELKYAFSFYLQEIYLQIFEFFL